MGMLTLRSTGLRELLFRRARSMSILYVTVLKQAAQAGSIHPVLSRGGEVRVFYGLLG